MVKTILIGKTKGNIDVDVIDLVPLFNSDENKFEIFFEQAQAIYESSFPEEERESTDTIRYEYIEAMAEDLAEGTDENYGDERFVYLVGLVNGEVKGMFSYDLIPAKHREGSIIFGGYIAVNENDRCKGIGRTLVYGMIKSANTYAKEKELTLVDFFGEIEKPDESSDEIRNIIGPEFIHNVLGAGVPIKIDEYRKAELIPYAQPGIKNGKIPDPVPLLPGITPIKNGSLEKITLEPGIIDSEGRLNRKIPCMDPKDVFGIIKSILDCYAGGESYSGKQIRILKKNIEKSFKGVEKIGLIPVQDTKNLSLPDVDYFLK